MSYLKNTALIIAICSWQNTFGQIDSISKEWEQRIKNNFLEYKKHIDYPHDTITIQTKDLPENPYEQKKNIITLAMGEPYGKIIINNKAKEEYITDYVIMHELTHTMKDSISTPLDYVLNDSTRITGINGLTFDILTPEGEKWVFGLIEEAAAEYIAYNIKPSEEINDPRYYALQYFMRILADEKLFTVKDLAKMIQHDDIWRIIYIFNLEKDPLRADKLLWLFSSIYQLGTNEANNRQIEEKVRDFVENHLYIKQKK